MAHCTIDAGHGSDTPGKRSPDGVLREYAWTRDVAHIVAQTLNARGVPCVNVVPEETDVPLAERCKRINKIAREHPENVHVSIHINAAGDGRQWLNARGWQVHTYTDPSVASRRLACTMFDEAKAAGFKVRPESPGMPFRPKNLAILRDTSCAAVLVENFFMDNKEDCAYLLTPLSIYECAQVISNAVLKHFGK